MTLRLVALTFFERELKHVNFKKYKEFMHLKIAPLVFTYYYKLCLFFPLTIFHIRRGF